MFIWAVELWCSWCTIPATLVRLPSSLSSIFACFELFIGNLDVLNSRCTLPESLVQPPSSFSAPAPSLGFAPPERISSYQLFCVIPAFDQSLIIGVDWKSFYLWCPVSPFSSRSPPSSCCASCPAGARCPPSSCQDAKIRSTRVAAMCSETFERWDIPAKVVDRLLWDWSVLNNLTGQSNLKIFCKVLQIKYPSLEPPIYTLTNKWIF